MRITEAAALAAARWMGRGDKEAADQHKVDFHFFFIGFIPEQDTNFHECDRQKE
ncbi:fructose-bisphosphatase class II [uncultured Trichococcus sp.]|uniref:fructose-bisphosphatase class II n=1 Tax=uncultured Trichococcus sp. TaxID=189665 RepID=UPI00338E53FC